MDNYNLELTNQIHDLINKIRVLINSKPCTITDISPRTIHNLSPEPVLSTITDTPVPNYLALTIKDDYKNLALSNITSKGFRITLKVFFGTFILNILKLFL